MYRFALENKWVGTPSGGFDKLQELMEDDFSAADGACNAYLLALRAAARFLCSSVYLRLNSLRMVCNLVWASSNLTCSVCLTLACGSSSFRLFVEFKSRV